MGAQNIKPYSWLNRYNANTVEYTSGIQQINVFPAAQVSATCSIVELFIATIALLTLDKLVMVLLTLQLLLGQLPATPLAPRLDSNPTKYVFSTNSG